MLRDFTALQGTILVAIAGCGGRIADDPASRAPIEAGTIAAAPDAGCPEKCYSAADVAALVDGWTCPAGETAVPGTPPAYDANGCVVLEDMRLEHCCEGECNSACTRIDVASGPRFDGTRCCYRQCGRSTGASACGRPLVVDGAPRVAEVSERHDWGADALEPAVDLDETTRAVLATAWLEDARMEHASIASFARFTLDLLAAGAPADMVAAAQRASLDEIEHARLCFALAARYAGRALGPGPLDAAGAKIASLEGAVAAAVREGCVGETIAAAVARAQLSVATDPHVRAVLERIAADEESHAALAWRFVAWALAHAPDRAALRAIVAEAFAEELRRADLRVGVAPMPGVDAARLHAHGRLGREDGALVVRAVLDDVIAPCAARLA